MRVTRYRVWKVVHGSPPHLWGVAADHRDGKKRRPFIYARSCEAAMNRLAARIERNKRRLRSAT